MSDFRFTRPDALPPIVKNLIIINVLVFVAQLSLESAFQVTEKIQLYPIMPEALRNILEQQGVYEKGQGFKPYQIATHMFAHSPKFIGHILFNMLSLWMLGRELENVWGPQRFLLFYLVCGVGAALFHLLIQYYRCEQLLQVVQQNGNPGRLVGAVAPAVGASGAIMGIFVAFAYLFPNTELYMMFIPIPIKAKWLVLGLAAFDIFGGVAGTDNIAHFAHLGGALTGFILLLIWNKTKRKRFY